MERVYEGGWEKVPSQMYGVVKVLVQMQNTGLNNKPGTINYICSLPQAFLFASNLEKISFGTQTFIRLFFSVYQNITFSLIASEAEGVVEYFVLVFLAFSVLQSTRRSSAVCKCLAQLKRPRHLLTLAANNAKH